MRNLLIGLALILSACSMRVSGIVSDRDSGQPVPACSVSIGEHYTYTDPTGRYALKTERRTQENIQFSAPGYAVQTTTVNAQGTRYPVLDVQLVRTSNAPPGARYDPQTGKPLYDEPRFDPYTGKPLAPARR